MLMNLAKKSVSAPGSVDCPNFVSICGCWLPCSTVLNQLCRMAKKTASYLRPYATKFILQFFHREKIREDSPCMHKKKGTVKRNKQIRGAAQVSRVLNISVVHPRRGTLKRKQHIYKPAKLWS